MIAIWIAADFIYLFNFSDVVGIKKGHSKAHTKKIKKNNGENIEKEVK